MKTTPFPPKGQVAPCFVVITDPYLAGVIERTVKLTGAVIAQCQDDGTLTLTNLSRTAEARSIPRSAVRRPYQWG